MDITQQAEGGQLHVTIAGRLDGYWADHLSATLTEVVRQGHHRIRLDCSQVTFLSSAGIGVLVQAHKDLKGISGSFHVVNPSKPVLTLLQMTRLADLLVPAAGPAPAPAAERKPRRVDRPGLAFDVFTLDAAARLACRSVGSPAPASGAFTAESCVSLPSRAPAILVGVGAFGSSFEDCRRRFGELLSIGGTTVYQPADGTNVADYLIGAGSLSEDIRMLHGVTCEGEFRQLSHFEPADPDGVVALSSLLEAAIDESGGDSAGVVVLGEASGLVGAALRLSPADEAAGGDLFEFPAIRSRIQFTTERAYPRSVALVAGVVTRAAAGARHPQLRPVGPGLFGHLHAAAFRFHPVRKGFLELAPTVNGLFEGHRLLGVLHLLYDDRGAAGIGESTFIRGACWAGPVDPGWLES